MCSNLNRRRGRRRGSGRAMNVGNNIEQKKERKYSKVMAVYFGILWALFEAAELFLGPFVYLCAFYKQKLWVRVNEWHCIERMLQLKRLIWLLFAFVFVFVYKFVELNSCLGVLFAIDSQFTSERIAFNWICEGRKLSQLSLNWTNKIDWRS